ncbi:MAG: tyrosine-protein phosphatase [Tannerellaceae bacterium]|jgi:protein-tyrosine phosphatase|nr:tyrosine-protein phosphatase [Tannerellaceae bacterium]
MLKTVNRQGVLIAAGSLFLLACNVHEPEITTICSQDSAGNCIIKWEVLPKMKGTVQLYVSDDPNVVKASPAGFAGIDDGILRYVTHDNFVRKYFRLVLNKTYQKIVASRSIMMDNVLNMRDLGGYMNGERKTVKWGKVFRSGDLSHIGEQDSLRLANLKIKTIVDLRMEGEAAASPIVFPSARVVSVPVVTSIDYVVKQVLSGKFRKGDVSLYMQDMYLQFTDNAPAFSQLLALFADEENYPVLISDAQGKDCAGYLSALILSALNVPEKMIFSDYSEVNELFNPEPYHALAGQMSLDMQEALSIAVSANETFLDIAYKKIKREKGSLARYITEELLQDERSLERIKNIMLY